jgi:hypothetical protein
VLVVKVLLVVVEVAVEMVVVMVEILEVKVCFPKSSFVTVMVKLVESSTCRRSLVRSTIWYHRQPRDP